MRLGEGEPTQPGSSERRGGKAFLAKSPGPRLCSKGSSAEGGWCIMKIHAGHTQRENTDPSEGLALTRSQGWTERPEGAWGWNTR